MTNPTLFYCFLTLYVQEEYHSEGIDATMVSYTDNRALLELFLSVSAASCCGHT